MKHEPTIEENSPKNNKMATYRPYITQIYPTTFDPEREQAAIITSENNLEPGGRPILVIFNPRTNEILERQRYPSPLLLNLNQPGEENLRILNDFQMVLMIPKQQRDMLMEVENLDLQIRILIHNPQNGLLSQTSLLISYLL